MHIYLFGYLSDDVHGRVIVTPDDRTVAELAAQLVAWGPRPEHQVAARVTNEANMELDLGSTLAETGLGNGDIFTVSTS